MFANLSKELNALDLERNCDLLIKLSEKEDQLFYLRLSLANNDEERKSLWDEEIGYVE